MELWRADRFDKPFRTLSAHPAHDGGLITVAFSPDGKWLASASRADPEAKVWLVETGERLATLRHAQPPSSLAFAGDGRTLVTADGDGTVRFWQTSDWKPMKQTLPGDGTPLLRIGCSPDGRYVAIASPLRGTIRIVDLQASPLREVRSWTLAGRLADIAFAQDSRHLATANANGTVYILRTRIAGE